MSELKPCPFCGSETAIFVEGEERKYRVQCLNDNCRCRTGNYRNYKYAIEAWNKRMNEDERSD